MKKINKQKQIEHLTKFEPNLKISEISEKSLISMLSSIFKINKTNLKNNHIILGAGNDDCAVIDIGNEYLCITTDMLHRKTDFPKDMSYWQIGWMSIAINLSDIASMGAKPIGVLSAIGMPATMNLKEIEEIAKGMNDCAKTYGTVIIGGDIDKHDELTITGTALGKVKKDQILTRQGASIGDLVCVIGNLGLAQVALFAIELNKKNTKIKDFIDFKNTKNEILSALFTPKPKIYEAQKLSKTHAVTAMMDISDGLCSSLYDLAHINKVGFQIYENKIPIDRNALEIVDKNTLVDFALNAGGDFGLLFTVKSDMIEIASNICDITIIGKTIKEREGIILKRLDGTIEKMVQKGYSHFHMSE
jgi:thiamine-monophosphate kinase